MEKFHESFTKEDLSSTFLEAEIKTERDCECYWCDRIWGSLGESIRILHSICQAEYIFCVQYLYERD